MTSSLGVFFVLLFGHFLGYYVFQFPYRDNARSAFVKSVMYSVTVTAAFLVGVLAMQVAVPFLLYSALAFLGVIFVTHFVIDVVAMRVSNNLWRRNRYKAFFSVVGFEQMLHQYVLLAATIWFVG
jgi:hypothetical protein